MANILIQNKQGGSEAANLTGFILTCEDRAEINETCSGDITSFNVSEFEWRTDSQIITLKNPHMGIKGTLNDRRFIFTSEF